MIKSAARLAASLGIVRPLVTLIARDVEEVPPRKKPGSAPTLLALNANRFRKDLEILAAQGFRVLKMPPKWQTAIPGIFWPKDGSVVFGAYTTAPPDSELGAVRARVRTYLDRLVPILFRRLGVDATVGACVWYEQDVDWGAVSQARGYPYVVLHRENLHSAPAHVRRRFEMLSRMGRFEGSQILVHNEVTRDIMIRAGFVDPERIRALGCMRMDGFLGRIAAAARDGQARMRRRAVLFSFHPAAGFLLAIPTWPEKPGIGFQKLFADVHAAFGQAAVEHPEIDFVIKLKWGGRWHDEVCAALRSRGIDPAKVPNLRITDDADAHDLILGADVVAGFGSTTIVEAAVAGKPVVFPWFDEAVEPGATNHVHFREERHVFDVAESPKQFQRLVVQRALDGRVDPKTIQERRRVFETHVSTLDGRATERYVQKILEIVPDAVRRRTERLNPQ